MLISPYKIIQPKQINKKIYSGFQINDVGVMDYK